MDEDQLFSEIETKTLLKMLRLVGQELLGRGAAKPACIAVMADLINTVIEPTRKLKAVR